MVFAAVLAVLLPKMLHGEADLDQLASLILDALIPVLMSAPAIVMTLFGRAIYPTVLPATSLFAPVAKETTLSVSVAPANHLATPALLPVAHHP